MSFVNLGHSQLVLFRDSRFRRFGLGIYINESRIATASTQGCIYSGKKSRTPISGGIPEQLVVPQGLPQVPTT